MRRGLRDFAETRPVWFTVALGAALAAFLFVRHRLFGGRVTYATAIPGEIALLLAGLVLTWLLGWWTRTGVTARLRPDWAVLALGGALVYFAGLGSPAFFLFRVAAVGFLLAALVGAAEELLCRGVVLAALHRFGPLAAGTGSAVFFGVLHLGNLLIEPSVAIVAQAAYAILLGLFLAAARLRLQSLWPVAVLHAGIDAPGLATGHFVPAPLANPWLALIPVALALPWGALGVAILAHDEHRGVRLTSP